jgi:hypothetical protein
VSNAGASPMLAAAALRTRSRQRAKFALQVWDGDGVVGEVAAADGDERGGKCMGWGPCSGIAFYCRWVSLTPSGAGAQGQLLTC